MLHNLPNPFELFNKKVEGLNGGPNPDGTTPSPSPSPTGTTPSPSTSPSPGGTTPSPSPTYPTCKAPLITKPPNPTFLSTTLFYTFIILFGFVSVIYYVYDSVIFKFLSTTQFNSDNFSSIFGTQITIYRFTIFIALWAIIYFFNLFTIDFIGIKEPLNILKITSIYYIGFVATTFIIIENIPSLVEVFENTFGYWIIGLWPISQYIFKLDETMEIFKSKMFSEKSGFIIPFDILLTLFELPTFNEAYKKYKDNKSTTDNSIDFYIDDDDDNTKKNDLLYLVFAKNNIGHMIWIYIACVITMMATINQMVVPT